MSTNLRGRLPRLGLEPYSSQDVKIFGLREKDLTKQILRTPFGVRSVLLLFGELLYGAREVHPHERLLSDNPCVVPGTYHVHVPRLYLLLRAVVMNDAHSPRNNVPRVLHLAARGLSDGLDGL